MLYACGTSNLCCWIYVMVTFSGKKTMPLFFKITEIISTSLQKLKRLAKIMDFLLCYTCSFEE
jgi:hypothetical protein